MSNGELLIPAREELEERARNIRSELGEWVGLRVQVNCLLDNAEKLIGQRQVTLSSELRAISELLAFSKEGES